MGNKTLTIVVVAAAVVIFGAGGYYIGSRSSSRQAAGPGGANEPQASNFYAVTADLKSRLDANPKDVDLVMRLADVYFDAKQFSEAAEFYKRALVLRPDDAEIYNNLGLSIHYLGNSAEGLRYVNDGVSKNPYHQRILLTKGFILAYGMGDMGAAKEAWEKARVINPDSQIGKAASEFLAQTNAQANRK